MRSQNISTKSSRAHCDPYKDEKLFDAPTNLVEGLVASVATTDDGGISRGSNLGLACDYDTDVMDRCHLVRPNDT